MAHYVVDGALGATCLGGEDATLTKAWEELALITPPEQLTELGLFGGFDSLEDTDEITLAYVNVLDDGGELFQMSVNLDACIHCNLCVRACREVQVNDVIGMAGRGSNEKIVFDFDDVLTTGKVA